LAALLHGTLVVGVSLCGVEQRAGRHLYSAGRPSRWTLASISSYYLFISIRVNRWSIYIVSGNFMNYEL